MKILSTNRYTNGPLKRYGRDSNPRPPAWQAGILTNWTTTPTFCKNSLPFRKRVQRYRVFLKPPNVFGIFFRKRWKKWFLGWFFFFLCSEERCFFIFLLPEQKKNETKRKFAVCIFLPTLVGDCTKEKELASLKQLFLFNVPSLSRRFTAKKRGRTFIFFKWRHLTLLRSLTFRHLVEERKENRVNFRKEQKAVWALASSFCLGNSPDF